MVEASVNSPIPHYKRFSQLGKVPATRFFVRFIFTFADSRRGKNTKTAVKNSSFYPKIPSELWESLYTRQDVFNSLDVQTMAFWGKPQDLKINAEIESINRSNLSRSHFHENLLPETVRKAHKYHSGNDAFPRNFKRNIIDFNYISVKSNQDDCHNM